MRFDVTHARSFFPALERGWALFDQAGGSPPARPVIERVAAHMRDGSQQVGATHALSQEASARVTAGREAAAAWVGAEPDEVVLGPSTTANVARLAAALRPTWRVGDEVVVTDLDHESNIGPWRRLAETGIVVREWRFDRDAAALRLEDLEPLLGPRTRLVCFTHCANVVGTLHDVAAWTRRIHAAGAQVCVDGVAFAPHRRVDVRALGVDWYLVSLYKVFGPHVGLLYGRREALAAARNLNHFFYDGDDGPRKLEPGGVTHELVAGLPGILEYVAAVDRRLGGAPDAPWPTRLERVFTAWAAHEAALAERLLAFLRDHPKVRVIGRADADPAARVPTVSFTVAGRRAREIPPAVDTHRVAIRFGHFYAARAIEALGLADGDGVVRASATHLNTFEEVDRLVAALDAAIG